MRKWENFKKHVAKHSPDFARASAMIDTYQSPTQTHSPLTREVPAISPPSYSSEKELPQLVLTLNSYGVPKHILISHTSSGAYTVGGYKFFNSLSDLLEYYQNNTLTFGTNRLILSKELEVDHLAWLPNGHYYFDVNRKEAEELVLENGHGSFIVRKKSDT